MDECFPKEIIFVTLQSRIQDFGSAGGLLIEEGDDILTWWGGGELQGKAKLYMRSRNNLRAERANFLFVLRPHLFLYSILYSILTSGSLPSGSISLTPLKQLLDSREVGLPKVRSKVHGARRKR